MLGNKQGKLLNKYTEDYVLFDLETTGVLSHNDEVIEISAVKVRKGKIVDEFSELVNPCRKIPWQASQVNNITHNIASFDMKFIYRDCEKYYGKTISNDYIDTLRLAKICFPNWKNRKLSDLADYYGISTEGAHRALTDCKINQKVFELLGKEMKKKENMPKNEKICPVCKLPLKKRAGRYGEFFGCTGYPECRYTENA